MPVLSGGARPISSGVGTKLFGGIFIKSGVLIMSA